MKSELINVRPDARVKSNGCNGTLEREEWRPVKGYEGLYEVSSFGRVRSLDRVVIANDGKKYHRIGKILLNHIDNWGYYYVGLCKAGGRILKKIHRLVAEAFIPNPDNLPQVNHRNENHSCNVPDNMEWCDAKYNSNYGTRGKRIGKANKGRISECHRKKMKPVLQYTLDGQLVAEYESMHDAERKTGFARANIKISCIGKREVSNGFVWKFKD